MQRAYRYRAIVSSMKVCLGDIAGRQPTPPPNTLETTTSPISTRSEAIEEDKMQESRTWNHISIRGTTSRSSAITTVSATTRLATSYKSALNTLSEIHPSGEMLNNEPLSKVPSPCEVPHEWSLRQLSTKEGPNISAWVGCFGWYFANVFCKTLYTNLWQWMGCLSTKSQRPRLQTRQTSYWHLSMRLWSNQIHGDGHPLTILIEYREKSSKSRCTGMRYFLESLLDI